MIGHDYDTFLLVYIRSSLSRFVPRCHISHRVHCAGVVDLLNTQDTKTSRRKLYRHKCTHGFYNYLPRMSVLVAGCRHRKPNSHGGRVTWGAKACTQTNPCCNRQPFASISHDAVANGRLARHCSTPPRTRGDVASYARVHE